MLNIQNRIYEIVDELRAVAEVVSEEELEKAAEMILDARKVVFTAQGRSGNSAFGSSSGASVLLWLPFFVWTAIHSI